MKLTLLEILLPKRALKHLQANDDSEDARFKYDMEKIKSKITKSGIELTNDEISFLNEIRDIDDPRSLHARLSEMTTVLDSLKEREVKGRRFFEEINKRHSEYKDSLNRSITKANLLLDALAKWTIILSTIFLLGILIAVYIYYKIYVPNFGMQVTQDWYLTVAQILPALLIALFLTGGRKNEKSDIENSTKMSVARSLMRESKFIGLIAFLIGEAACLTAIERGATGTGVYLFALSGLCLMGFTAFARILGIDSSDN